MMLLFGWTKCICELNEKEKFNHVHFLGLDFNHIPEPKASYCSLERALELASAFSMYSLATMDGKSRTWKTL